MMPQRLTEAETERIVSLVRATVDARRIVLFGSAAKGGMHEHSDVDVAVLVATPEQRRAAKRVLAEADLDARLDLAFPLELIVGDEQTWGNEAGAFGSLAHEVLTTGRDLYVA